MKAAEIIEKLKAGATITKKAVTKHRNRLGTIVSYRCYEYDIDGEKITEKQFDALIENGNIMNFGGSMYAKLYKYIEPQ